MSNIVSAQVGTMYVFTRYYVHWSITENNFNMSGLGSSGPINLPYIFLINIFFILADQKSFKNL